MSVIGAATGSGQPATGSAATAASFGVAAPAGGGTNAVAAAPGVDPAANATSTEPTTIEVVNAEGLEVAGIYEAAAAKGIAVKVSNREITPEEVLRNLNTPEGPSYADALEAKRANLLEALRSGKGDPKEIIKKLDGLSVLIDVARRQEEKKAFMKKLMKMLMLGILTPQMASQAKAFGLTRFLKEAVKAMVRAGNMTPNEMRAVAAVMMMAGIQMPYLDDQLVRHEKEVMSTINAARAARGQEATATSPFSQATVGARLAAPGNGALLIDAGGA